MTQEKKAATLDLSKPSERPAYEPPRIQVMTEREILNTFQITQSMAAWWITTCC